MLILQPYESYSAREEAKRRLSFAMYTLVIVVVVIAVLVAAAAVGAQPESIITLVIRTSTLFTMSC